MYVSTYAYTHVDVSLLSEHQRTSMSYQLITDVHRTPANVKRIKTYENASFTTNNYVTDVHRTPANVKRIKTYENAA